MSHTTVNPEAGTGLSITPVLTKPVSGCAASIPAEWKGWEKDAFRFLFLFFLLLIIPTDGNFYRELFTLDGGHFNFYYIFHLTQYQPNFFPPGYLPRWGIGSFGNWGVAIFIAGIGALVWKYLDKGRKEYSECYYWLRVLVRYRLAFVLIGYGFIKLFPLQMPYPSLSNLVTDYGSFFPWRIYYQTLAVVPPYESFLGFVEILGGLLFFYRPTATFGAGLILGFMGNVAAVNGFYDVGQLTLSTFIVVMSAFLLAYDVPRLYQLLIKGGPAFAAKYVPDFSFLSLHRFHKAFKVAFLVFVVVYGYLVYLNYTTDPYKIPHTSGLANAYGIYNVKKFTLNGKEIPYSKTDPVRWQNVVFEKWSTLSVKDNRPVRIDFSSGDGFHEKDIDRDYELAGAAGRHYYYYVADTTHRTLSLQDKNIHQRDEKLLLHYDRPNDSTIILSGTNQDSDSIYAELIRIHRKYLLYEGRRKPVKS